MVGSENIMILLMRMLVKVYQRFKCKHRKIAAGEVRKNGASLEAIPAIFMICNFYLPRQIPAASAANGGLEATRIACRESSTSTLK